ncbi:hypothetical protein ATE47_14155 [Chryseobacterium sp. IHB B 17019]|jgi:hypothetical protein|uniref:hypothetical protein n=1 Tax=Chryseobacterium sp. IHB B 17019 TaxID=1721091 RepID=UPI0007205D7D|nr:hypothetical protein [Chryseobacterium sp. IHB B 17019]ALR31578.1 hypothetical protein ATE47_14155 [Chryseobacterium sp. IHB B 17019]
MQNNHETLLKNKLKKINSSFILLDLGKLKVKKNILDNNENLQIKGNNKIKNSITFSRKLYKPISKL